jgi:endonuclease/exonuclease/phosphatase family metal-dependent hydrolase
MLRWLKDTIYKMLFSFNIVASILLFCVYLTPWVAPSKFHWFSILAIGYPFLFFVNLLFAAWWLYKRKRYFYLPLVVLILGFQHFFNFFGFNLISRSPSTDSVRVMSFNVHYFNSIGTLKDDALDKAQRKILRTIQEQPIDIFCGQEFSGRTAKYNKKATTFLTNEMGLKYSFHGGGSSLAIFSKYPIIKKGSIDFKGSYNGAIFADIQQDDKIVRVYSFHLQSIRLGNDENEIFNKKNLSSLNEDDTQKKYKRIGSKLKQAFLLREEQANFISKHIQESPYPVLVCGDMNDIPSSYAYGQLSDGLKDAFREKGAGFGSTYAGALPFLRIDYAFTSPSCNIQDFRVLPNTTSDHYPIYLYLTF